MLETRVVFAKTWLVGLALALVGTAGMSVADDGASTRLTFSKDVAPILFANCVSCHRPGDIAPMSLLTYDQARPWAKSIRAKVAAREMPPWSADPKVGKFRNELSLCFKKNTPCRQRFESRVEVGDPVVDD